MEPDGLNTVIDFFFEYGVWGLALVAFIEASFFPIPPDIFLIPLALAKPIMGFWYALICTLSSTLGAVFGRWIGLKVGRPFLNKLGSEGQIKTVESWFRNYGGWAVAFAGLTPIPFKLFTIASGVFEVHLRQLIIGSLLGRSLRFFFEVAVIVLMGEQAVEYLSQYSGPITFIGGLILIAWFFIRRLRRSK